MANTVAGLVVNLGLDATEYTRGLTKAEYQAQQFAKNTRTAILEVGKVFAALEIGRLVLDATKAIISEAAALNDLSDATGSSVESLSRLNNQVKISGGDIKEFESALLSLSKGMGGADKQSQQVQKTLALLGITTKDPAQAMQEIALKLNTYADGVNKVALAQALFGKSGREFLKTLQDMAELQDVGASVTKRQAEEAENLEKAWRQLSAEGSKFASLVLDSLVPGLTRLIGEFNDAIKVAGGFWAALDRLATLPSTGTIEETTKAIASLDIAISQARANAAHPILGKLQLQDPAKEIAKFEEQQRILSSTLARQQRANDALRRQENRGFDPRQQAPQPPAMGGGGRTKALKEATDEGLRYQQSLEKQLQATLQLSHAEEAEVAIFDALAKGQAGFSAERQATIRDMAQQLDTTEALKKAEEARKKSQQEIQQATNSAIKSAEHETASIKQGNEQLQEQIVFLRGGQEALDRLTDAKLADAIATKEQTLAALEYARGNEQLIAQTEEQIRQLKERQGLIVGKRAAEAAAEEAKKAKQFADDLGNALAQGAENAILHFNNLRDVLKNLEQDLLRIIARKLITEPLGNWLSGMIGGVLGGTSAGWPTIAGPVQGFASGGISSGGWAMVGEQGPEAVVLPRGAQVIPNETLMARRGLTVNNNFILSGAPDRRTQDQIASKSAASVQRAMRKVG